MPVGADRKRCVVVYATPTEQLLWSVELPLSATIGQALESARAACGEAPACAAIAWDSAPVGVFGEVRARQEQFVDGDRIELYRALRRDPRERRRERVQRQRSAARRS
jgi:putative ubiquitin-RnfH superfamily antitoxin RatB of RatAB toxin-antitoxin module